MDTEPAPTGVSPAVVKEFVEVLQKYLSSACTCDSGYGCSACDCTMDLSGILQKLSAS